MLQPSLRASSRLLTSCTCSIESALSRLRIAPSYQAVAITPTSVRYASHKSEGRANSAKQGPGKRLGSKKTGDQYVIPGNIIYRQRGTLWFPGENVGMGRDHTLYATSPGYVKFYRDPNLSKTRKYIGVTLERHHTLPLIKGVPRKRRLGMIAQRMPGALVEGEEWEDVEGDAQAVAAPGYISRTGDGQDAAAGEEVVVKKAPVPQNTWTPRITNYEIGKNSEKKTRDVKPFKANDRFLAWQKRKARVAKAIALKGLKKGKGKKR